MACLMAILAGTIHQVQFNAPNAHACGIVAGAIVCIVVGNRPVVDADNLRRSYLCFPLSRRM
jgi:hypothetical protein